MVCLAAATQYLPTDTAANIYCSITLTQYLEQRNIIASYIMQKNVETELLRLHALVLYLYRK